MGEKYDDCYYDYGPALQVQPLARLRDPTGPGFPPEDYAQMRQWGDAGKVALGNYLDRPSLGIESMVADSSRALESAGANAGSDAKVAAGQQVVERLNRGYREIQMQGAQGNMTLQMLDREGTIPTAELAETARGSARKMKQAVTDHVGPLEQIINDVLTSAQDQAVDAAGAQAEAAVNRIGQFAYTQSAGLYRELLRRGAAGDPGTAS